MKVQRRRRLRWLAAVVIVLGLIFAAVTLTLGTANQRKADDPRSPTSSGAGALGQLLSDEGLQVYTTNRVADALDRTTPTSTLVVANGGLLSADDAARLATTAADRVVLVRPNPTALRVFRVQAVGAAAAEGVLEPQCASDVAQRAGGVDFKDMVASYRATGPSDFTCYPTGEGYGYVRAAAETGRRIDLVAGGISNALLGRQGNASWALGVFGAQPEVVWLVAEAAETPATEQRKPTLLPPWWQIAVVQAALALIVVGIWRGRRLGPILTEPLPVTVRASETVEGHGRMYYRLNARDRAAEALRVGARARLARAFGHSDDSLALSEAVGARTGQPPQHVRTLLFGPPPETDDQLVELSQTLDRLEQEARAL